MQFSYRLTGTGWAVARITDEQGSAEIPASYLSDALGDLLAALLGVVGGARESRCSWDGEPTEYRWILRRDSDDVELRILSFYDIYKPQHDDAGRLVFQTRQPLAVFRRAITTGATRLLAEVGEPAYRERWVEHPFPAATLGALAER